MFKNLLEQVIQGQSLQAFQMQEWMQTCLRGNLENSEIAAFIVALRMKGETSEELSTAAKVMLDFSRYIDLGENCVDIVGTGGDGKNTFNVSTAAAFVAAGAGVKIAKHGNFSVSSSSGSANVLEIAGIPLQASDSQLQNCLQHAGLCFLFAPAFHPAMRNTREARQQLGIRSFFNLLGPLINPARVKRQVVGVFPQKWQEILARVLKNLGSERALILSSEDGLDEISIAAPTTIIELKQGELTKWTINPADYHLSHPGLQAIMVDSPEQSHQLIQQVLQGKKGPARDIVVLNSAAAIYCADLAADFSSAIEKSKTAIDEGSALHCFDQLKKWIHQ